MLARNGQVSLINNVLDPTAVRDRIDHAALRRNAWRPGNRVARRAGNHGFGSGVGQRLRCRRPGSSRPSRRSSPVIAEGHGGRPAGAA